MPFFVYGRDVKTGDVERRVISDAHSEAEARAAAEAAGLHVTVVVPAAEGTTGARALTPAVQASGKPTVDPVLVSENATFQKELRDVTPNTPVTYTLVALNFLVFIAMVVSGVAIENPKLADLVRWGADYGPKTLAGEPWRLFTSIFLHIGIVHIASNMLVFAYVGPTVERMLGNLGFLVLYLIAGLAGSLWSLYWDPMDVGAGASGAIFGVYGALVAVILREKETIPSHVAARLVRFVGIFVVYNLVNSLQPGISLSAHVGGLVAGFVCGLGLAQPISREALSVRPLHDLVALGAGALMLVFGLIGLHARYPNLDRVDAALTQFAEVEIKIPKAIQKIDEQVYDNGMDRGDAAAAIEQAFDPDWSNAQAAITAVSPIPASLESDVSRILDYMKYRNENWRDLADALRNGNENATSAAESRMSDLNTTSSDLRRSPLLHTPFD